MVALISTNHNVEDVADSWSRDLVSAERFISDWIRATTSYEEFSSTAAIVVKIVFKEHLSFSSGDNAIRTDNQSEV